MDSSTEHLEMEGSSLRLSQCRRAGWRRGRGETGVATKYAEEEPGIILYKEEVSCPNSRLLFLTVYDGKEKNLIYHYDIKVH